MNDQAETPTNIAVPPVSQGECRNCGAPLYGEHCYACGQPVKGLVRPLGSLFGDVLDNVFNIDTRIVRTLGPLFVKPGFLTAEYFAGRQVRYVTPVRLLFFLCIAAFFIARLAFDSDTAINVGDPQTRSISAAATEAEAVALRDKQLAALAKAKKEMAGTPAAAGIPGIEKGEQEVRDAASTRIAQLRKAIAAGQPTPPPAIDESEFGNWDEQKNPVHLTGAPAFVDGWFNRQIGRAKHNITRIQADPAQYLDAFVGAIPTALFVLVPIFALLLKLAYLLKRRLYMEHLVVALHSHAFISLDLLLVFACMALQRLLPEAGIASTLLGWCIGLLVAWMPVYLLLMQKRVYAQGWPMTLLKYFALGTVYMTLLSFAIAGAAVASLVWM